jgi:hypothetical protein
MKRTIKLSLGSLLFVFTSAFATIPESNKPQIMQPIFGTGNFKIQQLIDGKPQQVAAGCFKSGEETSGMNKICYYRCVGGDKAITISSTSLCPLSL